MPKGLRMDRAYDPADGAVRMAADAESGDGFLCEGCRCPVSRVRAHVVGGQDELLRRHVPAFFRLKPDAEHAANCRHTPGGQVVELVRESRAVEDARNPFEDGQNGGYVFRINIPQEEIRAQGVKGEEYDKAVYRERAERVWSGRRLAPYCRSAVGLARLWALMDGGHCDLQAAVTIQDRGNDIRWEDFFFPPIRYASLASRVEGHGLGHAVAALVVVRKLGENARGAFVEGTGMPGRTRQRSIIAPQIYVPARLLPEFVVGGRYIVFGTWGSYDNPWTPKDGRITTRYRNLTMTIFQRSQFCRIDLPVEGEDKEE